MSKTNLETLTNYKLVLNLAAGLYSKEEIFAVLSIIEGRESGTPFTEETKVNIKKAKERAPIKGSKAEKIYNLLLSGKTPSETYQLLKAKNVKISPSEVYRVARSYWPDTYDNKQ